MDLSMTNEYSFLDEKLNSKMNKCQDIPAHKIKKQFSESCEKIAQEHSLQDPALSSYDKMMPQDCSVEEEELGQTLMKEKIKKEVLEDQSSLTDCILTTGPENCLQAKEMIGDVLMKEEIKEEDLEDEIPFHDQVEEKLLSQEDNSTNTKSEPVEQNCLEEKMQCLASNVKKGCSHSNSKSLLIPTNGKKRNFTLQEKEKIDTPRYHKKTRKGENPFKCSSCSYQTTLLGNLNRHERTHTGEKPFKCISCPYQAARKSDLKIHERTHTGERPFKCTSCPYQAARIGHLKYHERTHTDEKPYKCSSCSYRATIHGHLKRHERTHTGERPFKCSSCSYRATELEHLKRHKRIHTRENSYKIQFLRLSSSSLYQPENP